MLQLKYNNEFLDLAPDHNSEMEKNSPLFLGLDTLLAEYSTPIALKYSDKNARLLGYLFFDITVKTKKTFEVEIYSNRTFITRSSLIIESAGMNFRFASKSSIAGYLLTGISNFFIYIKNKKLTDLSLGGNRSFTYTTSDPDDASDGYWQHIQGTWAFANDYVFVPARNQAFIEDDIQFAFTAGWMNKLTAGNTIDTRQPVVPWVKLSYVLNQIFLENGWTLDTTGLSDTEWENLLLYSNYLVPTNDYHYNISGDAVATNKTSISINLAYAMPQDTSCSKFILELCKKYFWFPITDTANETVKLFALKEAATQAAKDWTKWADPIAESDFSAATKIFSYKNIFEGEDQYPASEDLSAWDNVGYATAFEDLPDLISGGGSYNDWLMFVFLENKYYSIETNGTTKTWTPKTDNIYDADTDNATDTFETKVTTLPITRVQFENGKMGVVPIVNQPKKTKWGIRTILYHGLTAQTETSGDLVAFFYPYASCINTPLQINPQLTWSNVLKHSNVLNEFGIIEYWAKRWLQMINSCEIVKRNFYLPLHELKKFQWHDVILVHNIPYFIKSYIEPLNKQGFIQATLQRISLVPYSAEYIPPVTEELDVLIDYDEAYITDSDDSYILYQP